MLKMIDKVPEIWGNFHSNSVPVSEVIKIRLPSNFVCTYINMHTEFPMHILVQKRKDYARDIILNSAVT